MKSLVLPGKKRIGIKRNPAVNKGRPRDHELHQAILDVLSDEPMRVVDIARAIDHSPAGTSSMLYTLQNRGLVIHVLRAGWRKA
jgi:Mn-dependent DtxR family transcriptional regulator